MNSSTLRRLASDQASLRRSLPPNYLFPEDGEGDSLPDDLTQLVILLTGTHGTPYSQGLWRLQLKMPDDYPKNPPKAIFKTRIFHPNVEESTGAVCLDTLKKDWQSTLTLRDVLITISCLLINPNPDSALNAAAGSLIQEDYDAFAKQARLMASIHAPIPSKSKSAALEAKHRGEEGGMTVKEDEQNRPAISRASSSTSSLVMKKNKSSAKLGLSCVPRVPSKELETQEEDQQDDVKENDPSQSPSPVTTPLLSPRSSILGKRPLAELPTPTESDGEYPDESDPCGMTASQKNIVAGERLKSSSEDSQPVRKSPKLERSLQSVPQETKTDSRKNVQIYEDATISSSFIAQPIGDEKENAGASEPCKGLEVSKSKASDARPTLRKVSNVGSARAKGPARVGIRRF